MGIKTQEEAMEEIFNYANAILDLQLQKKGIDEDIKAIKQEYKEEGVAVGKVTKVLNRLKARDKLSEADRVEEDILYEKLEAHEPTQNNIAALNG